MSAAIDSRSDDGFIIKVKIPYAHSMLAFEEAIQTAANAVGATATQEALEQFDTDGSPIQFGATKLFSKGREPKTYQAPYGAVSVLRHVYQSAKGGKTFCPLYKFESDPNFDPIAGSERRFQLEVRLGAEAYICGEETALLDSLEGKRGMVRFKPPLPALEGLFGRPTVVNNVLTLAAVTTVLAQGSDYYRDFGSGRSRGTLALQLAGNIKRGGLVELAFGTTLRALVEDFGGGSHSGRPLRAIQIGGPLGGYLAASHDRLTWVWRLCVLYPIQRPFVWNSTKVRDLMDSLYQGWV